MNYIEEVLNCCAIGGLERFPEDDDILCTLKGRTYKKSEACENCCVDYDAKDRIYWEPSDYCYSVDKMVARIREELSEYDQSVIFASTNNAQLKAGAALAQAGFTVYHAFRNPNSGNIVTIWHFWRAKGKGLRNTAPAMV